MTVVCDTNVFVSSLLAGGIPEKIVQAARRGQIRLATSPALLQELSTVLTKKIGWKPDDARLSVQWFEGIARVVHPIQPITHILDDPSDNRVLECAVEAHARFIVTGDQKHLLPLKSFRGIPILSPRNFILQVLYQ